MDFKIFEYPLTVQPVDIDEQGHVNNISYLKWVQDVAIAHWNSVAPKEMNELYMWVVSRHEIDYLKQAFIDTKLIAKTWVVEPEGAKSFRYVDICDSETGTLIAKIKTTWYLLDFKTKKPKRIDATIVSIFQ
ncbi:MAG: thioesterase family protein [Bacteroidota bacterium]